MSEENLEESRSDHVPDPPSWATVPRAGGARGGSPRQRLSEVRFPLALRGYDRHAVDEYVKEVARAVAELESARMRAPAVRRALEEVGEQTSEILRQAHETADEIAARSRSQAEGRLQRAEAEAAGIRREAEDAARRLRDDNRQLVEERRRLIEEIRTMAQDVLAVADQAFDRLPVPADDTEGDRPPAERDGAAAAGEGEPGARETVELERRQDSAAERPA